MFAEAGKRRQGYLMIYKVIQLILFVHASTCFNVLSGGGGGEGSRANFSHPTNISPMAPGHSR